MKPSGKVELLIITQMPPFRTSWLYLVPPFTLPLGFAASLVEERYEHFLNLPNLLAKKYQNCFIPLV
ncbi:hypothetical protein [Xylanibacter ruminicola]|uniref:Uncharacterized protein n=1 Tax=Xylanibacter ruminicola TaxID=839 RepID=A0A1M6W4S7_XYLRU|nr:hypothetical protein [Xylanibacter ruminicola]SHK88761.1 hypothetical protein SAMN05216463_11555 [Xylanibacter ruminicola]